jgi:hypothetical protein
VHDLSGTEPFDLIRTAKAIEAGDAVGRFAGYARMGESSDPINDLQTAATASLLCRNRQQERLQVGARHGRAIASVSMKVNEQSNGAARVLAINSSGMCVDHSGKEESARKRNREAEFGGNGDCPKLQSVRWDWKGLTCAPAASWRDCTSPNDDGDALPRQIFKCRVVMKGSDVFAGMKALMEAGVMKAPLPSYVRDAPMLGGVICVDRGAIVISKDESS